MNISFPHTIENLGEKIIFKGLENGPQGEKVLVESYVTPGNGPLMHTHFLQDEQLTVINGTIGYEIPGQDFQYATVGDTVIFKRGTPHRFWNAGDDTLVCQGEINPANTVVFFLSSVFAAQNKTGTSKPESFDAAYLLTKYRSEYAIQLPRFVKLVIIPAYYWLGKILGKHKKFRLAPAPIKNSQQPIAN